jgi:HEAT repeat protein
MIALSSKAPSARMLLVMRIVISVLLVSLTATAQEQSVETLLTYLKSPIALTRRDAARKLGDRRVKDKAVVEALVVAAGKDEDEEVRAEALRSLGLIKDFSALDAMVGGVKDADPQVRKSAIKALVSLYTEHDIDFITNKGTMWDWLNPFLDKDDHEIIPVYVTVDPGIIAALGESARSDSDRTNRLAAIRALGVLRGADALPQLADALTSDRGVRMDVFRAFIKIGDANAGPYLIPFFRDSDQKVRTQAMFAAGMLKSRDAVEPLLSIYGLGADKKGLVSIVTLKIKGRFEYLPPRDEAALWALSLIGDPRAEQVFEENLDEKSADRRQYAIEGLGRIGEHRYEDQLSRKILTEKNGDVKLAEHWAMYKMGDRGELQEVTRKLDSGQSDQARAYLLEVNNPADLYPYVESSSKYIRLSVIQILGQIGDQESLSVLKPVARNSGREISDAATVAIKSIEWRLSGHPNTTDSVLRGDPNASRPRKVSGP